MLMMLHDLLLLDVMLEALLFSSSMSQKQEGVHEVLFCLLRPFIAGGISATVVGCQGY
jgi:hypothetical protein